MKHTKRTQEKRENTVDLFQTKKEKIQASLFWLWKMYKMEELMKRVEDVKHQYFIPLVKKKDGHG